MLRWWWWRWWWWWEVLVLLRISLMVVSTVVSSPFPSSDRNLIIIGVITTGFRSLYTRTFIQTGVHRSAVKVHSSQRSRLVVVSGFYSTVSRICTRSTTVKSVLNNLSCIGVKGVELDNLKIMKIYIFEIIFKKIKNATHASVAVSHAHAHAQHPRPRPIPTPNIHAHAHAQYPRLRTNMR